MSAPRAEKASLNFWEDPAFLDRLVHLLCNDLGALKQAAPVLTSKDFEPLYGMRHAQQRWVVAERALEHFRKHNEPLGDLLRSEVLAYARSCKLGDRAVKEFEEYLQHLAKIPLSAPDAVVDKIVAYKQERLRASVIQEMGELQAAGMMTPEKWSELTAKARFSQNGHDPNRVNRVNHVTERDWPQPLGRDARYGLSGEFMEHVEPVSEADPAALLLGFLAAFGNQVGHSPRFETDGAEQTANICEVTAGDTAKARKGSSWGWPQSLFSMTDTSWKVTGGLSSGEGLIHCLSDSGWTDPDQNVDDYSDEFAINDKKRLMIVETEFGRVLQCMKREGNTLSAVFRQAWDSGNLSTLTKNSPQAVKGAHISMVGHITIEELHKYMDYTSVMNGFANRILWVCARRSKELPFAAPEDRERTRRWAKLTERVRTAMIKAREVQKMDWADNKVRNLWKQAYSALGVSYPSALGAVTSRSEAQVTRLACIYALLDGCDKVKRQHLKAALAVWKYCFQSARFLFGDEVSDPVAATILKALRANADGLGREEIRRLFQGNLLSAEIEKALEVLQTHQLAVMQKVKKTATQIRPTELWRACS